MSIAENISLVRERIAGAAALVGRNTGDITLIAVTKTVGVERIREAIDAGITDIGENYLQPAAEKFDELDREVRWHMIGHLQTNKVKQSLPIFDMIHSVDSISLAREIGKRSAALGKVTDVLVEVNISGEESKFGVQAGDVEALCEGIVQIEGVNLQGLMGIAPFTSDLGAVRGSFALLRSLWDNLPGENRIWLSMGMTSDFEIAIEEGSNMLRIGTAIFGPRGGLG